MNVYFKSLSRLYQAGKITEAKLTEAVAKAFISPAEKGRILAGD
ncbi:MAG: hypothetical protein RR387_03570 [Clostridiales bacterium]